MHILHKKSCHSVLRRGGVFPEQKSATMCYSKISHVTVENQLTLKMCRAENFAVLTVR